jgi:3-isopropylmalate/(R)-2-methylmalate dehydratase small subunit
MEDIDPDFPKKVSPGDIIVAGRNFGCGSSREHAQLAIKGSGVACVVAESFARIFYRNAINVGLPIAEIEDSSAIKDGDYLEVDLDRGTVLNLSEERIYKAAVLPDFIQDIIRSGGLLKWVKKRHRKGGSR